MIGYYDYTVWLTYFSLISAGIGIFTCLSGTGHPFIGMFFLLISGLCDAFDGKVARTKKNRTEMQIDFGIQIDSLADLVAFGVLPASIGVSMLRIFDKTWGFTPKSGYTLLVHLGLYAILVFYVLAALIRLAFFNVLEAQRRREGGTGANKEYRGLPVTAAALLFPTVLLIQYATEIDITLSYFATVLVTGVLFITPFKLRKPGTREILIMVGIGALELTALIIMRLIYRR
ncbi:MAG: CDP-alcohol phosphatidyltransferase family protein [Clostridiales bacterium]|nr:CDP-alcohol phosphatidyltransferase family protein [Clostridiales bacterium]